MISEKKILENNVINFFNKKKNYRSLSNFWECDVIIEEDRLYESGEHCFQGEKYIQLSKLCNNKTRKNTLFLYGCKFTKPSLYKKCNDVKKMGGKNGLKLSDDELFLWNKLSIDIQEKISRYKLEKYEEVKIDLLKSIGKILIHPALRCSEEQIKYKIWEGKGIVSNGEIEVLGKNKLGNIWMSLRDELF